MRSDTVVRNKSVENWSVLGAEAVSLSVHICWVDFPFKE